MGSSNRYNDNEWLGWNGKDFNATIHFKEQTDASSLSLRLYNNPSSWVYPPSEIKIFGSMDGKNFSEIVAGNVVHTGEGAVQIKQYQFKKTRFSHLKVVAKNHGIISKSNPGEGYPAWLFVDELVVE
jgi:hexosaminidase